MSDLFSGVNKFHLESSSATKIKSKVVGVSFEVQSTMICMIETINSEVRINSCQIFGRGVPLDFLQILAEQKRHLKSYAFSKQIYALIWRIT